MTCVWALRIRIPNSQENNVVVTYITENIDRDDQLSLSLTLPLSPTAWWNIQNNLTGLYQRVETMMKGDKLYPKFEYGNFETDPSHIYEVTQQLDGDKLHFEGIASGAESKTFFSFKDVFQRIDKGPARVASNQ